MKFAISAFVLVATALPAVFAQNYPNCNICGGNLQITKPNTQLTFRATDTPCFELQGQGSSGNISPAQCRTLPNLVGIPCGCEAPNEFPVCNICGEQNGVEGVITNPNNQVIFKDVNDACFELQGQGAAHQISPTECAELPDLVRTPCGCEYPTPSPTNAPTRDSRRRPTTTCDICNDSNKEITNPRGTISLSHRETKTCSEWQAEGQAGELTPGQCSRLQRLDARQNTCQCETRVFRHRRLRSGNAD